MTSREQFESWYFKRYGVKDLTVVRNHAEFCDAVEVWQASRAAIEIELPEPCSPGDFCVDIPAQAHHEVIEAIESAGLKVKK